MRQSSKLPERVEGKVTVVMPAKRVVEKTVLPFSSKSSSEQSSSKVGIERT